MLDPVGDRDVGGAEGDLAATCSADGSGYFYATSSSVALTLALSRGHHARRENAENTVKSIRP